MAHIRYATEDDRTFWYSLDEHLSKSDYSNKVKNKQCYIIESEDEPVGILRYSLFWDQIPFLNLIFITDEYQMQGFGEKLIRKWESDMRLHGYTNVLVSTQVDEKAQFFYRKLGYKDCGCLILEGQSMEMFMSKLLK